MSTDLIRATIGSAQQGHTHDIHAASSTTLNTALIRSADCDWPLYGISHEPGRMVRPGVSGLSNSLHPSSQKTD